MDTAFFDQLLYEGESPTLDFKKEQYPFSKAMDEEKSELLKDILGFVNAWRRSDAYILIGVEDVQGGRSIVVGVSEHLQDHSVQQFVNNLTNRPIRFGYEAFEFEGKQVGVIRIEQQHRPIYLKRDYGKLQKDKVYVRRGSSTDPQKPAGIDEIATMGNGQSAAMQKASVMVEFADTEREMSLGDRIMWTAEMCRMPDGKEIPTFGKRPSQINHPLLGKLQVPEMPDFDLHRHPNPDYFHDLAEYELVKRLFRKVRLVVSNTGDVPATDVRIEMSVPTKQGIIVLSPSKFPAVPKRRIDLLHPVAMRGIHFGRPAICPPGHVNIEENSEQYKIEVECGNLQPGRKVWSDDFFLGIGRSGEAQLTGSLLAGNLPGPQEFRLIIEADISQSQMTVKELCALPDPVDEEG